MSRPKQVLLCALAVVFVACAAVTGALLLPTIMGTASDAESGASGREDFSRDFAFDLSEGDGLRVDGVSFDTRIEAFDGQALTAVFRGHRFVDSRGRAPDLRAEKRDGMIVFTEVSPAKDALIQLNIGGAGQLHGTLEIKVPRAALGQVKIATVSGDAQITGVSAASLSASATSGKLDGSALNVTGDLRFSAVSGTAVIADSAAASVIVDTTSGSLDLLGVTAARVDMSTVSGGLTARALSAETIDMDSTSGGCDAELMRAPDVDFSSVSGGLKLTLPKDAGFACKLDTVSGSLNLHFPGVAASGQRNRSATAGDGARSVNASTTSGSVTITAKP